MSVSSAISAETGRSTAVGIDQSGAPARAANRSVPLAPGAKRDERPPQIKSLTVLRIFPAFLVVFFHSQHHFSFLRDAASAIAFPQAVAFFFVLSGFILAYNYWGLNGKQNTIRFYFARVARMWPAHALTLLLLVLLVPEVFRITKDMVPVFFANFFLVQAWIPTWKSYFSYNAPAWSNSTEVSFYAFFPILLWCMRKRWWLPILLTGLLTLGLVAYCTVMRLPECDPSGGLSEQALTFIFPLSRVVEFTVGMSAAMLLRKIQHKHIGLLAGTALEICAIAFVCFMNLSSAAARAAVLPVVGSTAALWVQNSGMAIVAFYVLFLVFSLQRGLISKLFSMPLFVALGEMSFGVYMLHSVILAYRGINFPADQSVSAYIMFWMTLIVGAHLMWILVERPMRKLIMSTGDVVVFTPWKLLATSSMTVKQKLNIALAAIKATSLKKKAAAAPKTGPNWRSIIVSAEVVFFIGLLYFSLPTIHPITAAEAHAITGGANAVSAEYAPYLKCVSASAQRSSDTVVVTLIWEAMQDETLDFRANATGMGKNGTYLCQMSYLLDPRHQRVRKGTIWKDTFELPTSNSYRAEQVGSVLIDVAKGKMPLSRQPMSVPL